MIRRCREVPQMLFSSQFRAVWRTPFAHDSCGDKVFRRLPKRHLAAVKREGKVTFEGPPKSGRYRLEG